MYACAYSQLDVAYQLKLIACQLAIKVYQNFCQFGVRCLTIIQCHCVCSLVALIIDYIIYALILINHTAT